METEPWQDDGKGNETEPKSSINFAVCLGAKVSISNFKKILNLGLVCPSPTVCASRAIGCSKIWTLLCARSAPGRYSPHILPPINRESETRGHCSSKCSYNNYNQMVRKMCTQVRSLVLELILSSSPLAQSLLTKDAPPTILLAFGT